MESCTNVLDWKNQHCENDYTTQSNIYRFNEILIKLPMAFFTEPEQKHFTICMETKKTPNSQSNLEGKKTELEESGSLTSDNTTKLQ